MELVWTVHPRILSEPKEQWSIITVNIFRGYDNFRHNLERTLGDIDSEAAAERRLRRLRQLITASAYVSEFYQIISSMNWNETAYISALISGLKVHVKDEMTRMERPETLAEVAELAVKMDNRYFERQLERKEVDVWRRGSTRPQGQSNTSKPRSDLVFDTVVVP
ncbi:hypothetical protein CBS11852_4976 [Aspergillus niger]|nr:hypothetical protein CBS11852_4976 [Aspergillus niger]